MTRATRCDPKPSSALLRLRLRGELDRLPDADIGPAAADVAAHRIVDVRIGRMRLVLEQCRGRHDLAGLAVSALRDLMVEPSLLDLRTDRCRTNCLDRGDFGLAYAVDRRDAGTDGGTVEMHGTGAAQRHATAELRARHAEHVTQNPQQRRVPIDVDAARGSVNVDGKAHDTAPCVRHSTGTTHCRAGSLISGLPPRAEATSTSPSRRTPQRSPQPPSCPTWKPSRFS